MSVAHHDEHHDAHHGDDGHEVLTLRGYLTGFVLAVILTIIPFWLVMDKTFSSTGLTALAVLGLGAVQMIVHMVYFLHMNSRAEGGWNMLAMIFTLIIVVIAMAGSLWVMYHLNENMMPDMIHEIQQLL